MVNRAIHLGISWGVAWSPLDLGANLIAWYKADAGAYVDAGTTLATDGQTVQQWNDQSGNGYHLKQATAGARPTYRSSVLNSMPAIDPGTGNDRWMKTDADSVAMGTGVDGLAYVVAKVEEFATPDNDDRLFGYLGNGQTDDFSVAGSAAWMYFLLASLKWHSYRAAVIAESGAVASNVAARIGAIFDGANETFYLNNSAGTPVAFSSAWTSPGTFVLFTATSTGSSGNLSGCIVSEIIVANVDADSTLRGNIDTYLQRWF